MRHSVHNLERDVASHHRNMAAIHSDNSPQHDDRLRELSVKALTLIGVHRSQVILLHGFTNPCSYFRRSENNQRNAVLGRMGQRLRQSDHDS